MFEIMTSQDNVVVKMYQVLSVSQEDFRYRKLLLASQTTLEDLADSDGRIRYIAADFTTTVSLFIGVTNMWKLVHQEPCSRTRTAFIFRSRSLYIVRQPETSHIDVPFSTLLSLVVQWKIRVQF